MEISPVLPGCVLPRDLGKKLGSCCVSSPLEQGLRAPDAEVSELPAGTPSCLPLTKGLGY